MKPIKRIDMTLVNLIAITFISFFQVFQSFDNANRILSIMAFIGFAIFYLMTLIYLYVAYIREPRNDTYSKWSKEKWVRIGGIVAGAYFLFLVFFPVMSKNEWVYYCLIGMGFLSFVLHIILTRIFKRKGATDN